MLDTNIVVAAIRRLPRITTSHRLVATLLADPSVRLVTDPVLAQEYDRWAARFPGPGSQELCRRLQADAELVRPGPRALRAVLPYFAAHSAADAVHAAACLEVGATLVSNDQGFRALARSGLVEVLRTTEALHRLGIRT